MFKKGLFQIVKATLFSVVFSLLYVLAFTVVVQLARIPQTAVKPVNQVFKIIAVAIGTLIFVRGEKGYLKGATVGLCSVVLCYVLFSIIGGSFKIAWTFALEILICAAGGCIAGIIAVNVKKS